MSETIYPIQHYYRLETHISKRNAIMLWNSNFTDSTPYMECVANAVAAYSLLVKNVASLNLIYDNRKEIITPKDGYTMTVPEDRIVPLIVNLNAVTAIDITDTQIMRSFNTEQYIDDVLRVYSAVLYGKAIGASMTLHNQAGSRDIVLQ